MSNELKLDPNFKYHNIFQECINSKIYKTKFFFQKQLLLCYRIFENRFPTENSKRLYFKVGIFSLHRFISLSLSLFDAKEEMRDYLRQQRL